MDMGSPVRHRKGGNSKKGRRQKQRGQGWKDRRFKETGAGLLEQASLVDRHPSGNYPKTKEVSLSEWDLFSVCY
jgi:hypothetical protein